MDADPWADAPSTPRLDDSTPQASPSKPARSSPTTQIPPHASTSSPPLASPNGRLPSDLSGPQEGAIASPNDLSPTDDAGEEDDQLPGAVETDGRDAGFDDFDDFDEPAAGPSTLSAPGAGDDDGFGDFGDFEEGDEAGEAFEAGQSGDGPQPQNTAQRDWAALHLDPFPSASSLRESVHSILLPLASASSSSRMTDEPPREVGGLGQIMISESSREAYAQLTTPPMLKSLDWTRSRVRREHLISMGVPVNLDEVDSHRLSSLPPLRITTTYGSSARPGDMGPPPVPRPASVDGRRRTTDLKGKNRISLDQPSDGRGNGIQSGPASAAPRPGTRDNYGLEPRPALDMIKAEKLCGLDESALSLINIDKLRGIQDDLVDTSAQASAVLAWLLQLKDAQTQDSATYNGMISELIANAAKAKQAQSSGSGGVFRRSSLQQRPQSSSGNITPRRIGSPAMR